MNVWRRIAIRIRSQFISRRFQRCGAGLRVSGGGDFIGMASTTIGNNVLVGKSCWFNVIGSTPDALSIGDDTYVGNYVQINAMHHVRIGNNVLIGDRVLITDCDHVYDSEPVPVIRQGVEFKGGVKICDGAWIGIGAIILPGVTVGEGSVVGANAVVTRDVAARSVAVGPSAKVIKQIRYRTHDV